MLRLNSLSFGKDHLKSVDGYNYNNCMVLNTPWYALTFRATPKHTDYLLASPEQTATVHHGLLPFLVQDTQTDCVQDTAQRMKLKRLKASTALMTRQTDAEQRRPTIKKLEVKLVEFKLGEDCWEIQVKREITIVILVRDRCPRGKDNLSRKSIRTEYSAYWLPQQGIHFLNFFNDPRIIREQRIAAKWVIER
ncbi:hypothetical protein Tco_1310012 [Tanacetum coccineum]